MPTLSPRTFSLLFCFETCARLLSFSAAAKELCITTGAVSQKIRQLESQLSFTLFLRAPSGVRLTEEGKELFTVMRQSVDSTERVIKHLQTKPNDDLIHLKSTPSFAFKWLIPKLNAFSIEVPENKVEIYAEAALLDLSVSNFDLAIDYSNGEYQHYDASMLIKETLTPVINPSYLKGIDWDAPNVWDKVILLHDSMPWLNAPKDAEWRYWLDTLGLPNINSKSGNYFNRSDMAIAAAEAGLGVALARGSIARKEIASGSLITPFPSLPSCRDYYLITPKGRSINRSAAALKNWLLTEKP
jgi:DNA-binding transcriptional LysR family regulator